MVIELKVKPKGENYRGDSPAAALMQGLRYAAIVEANIKVIAGEAKRHPGDRFKDVTIVEESPIVQILAPKSWWRGWLELRLARLPDAGSRSSANSLEMSKNGSVSLSSAWR